jgi:hypothetical protein
MLKSTLWVFSRTFRITFIFGVKDMPQLSRKNKRREFWLSSPYSHPLLAPPTRTLYSHPLLAPPTHTSYSHLLLAPPTHTSYSHLLLAPPTHISYSHPLLAPATRTRYSHPILAPPTRTPYSHPLLAPPTRTPLLSSYSQFYLYFPDVAMIRIRSMRCFSKCRNLFMYESG